MSVFGFKLCITLLYIHYHRLLCNHYHRWFLLSLSLVKVDDHFKPTTVKIVITIDWLYEPAVVKGKKSSSQACRARQAN